MKLQDYLQAIKECPDGRLSRRLGVGDNETILTRIPAKDLARKIQSKFKRLEFKREFGSGEEICYQFYYVPGTLVVNVTSRTGIVAFPGIGLDDYVKRVKAKYNSSIMLHADQGREYHLDGKEMPVHDFRAAALCTEELIQFMLEEKISFCIPASQGNFIKDISKIVYSPDSDEEKINRSEK